MVPDPRPVLSDDLVRAAADAPRVLFHLIEETARHNGHIDILREMADGVTGR